MDTQFQTRNATLEAPHAPASPTTRTDAPAQAPARKRPAQEVAPRRSKAEALQIARRLKRGAAVAAMLGFSMSGVAIGSHLLNTSATTTTSSATSTSSSTSSSSGDGYFSQSSGGSSFGSSSSSSSPVTSTSTS